MTMTRRSLLRSLAALGAIGGVGALGFSRRLARASGTGAKRFVLVFAGGGWDPTYVFDPKPGSAYVDMGVGELAPFGSGQLWFDAARPSVTEYFNRYGAITSVLNGINVPAVAHESCRVRMLTGSRDRTRPDLSALIGHEIGAATPMPCLDIGGGAYVGALGADLGYLGERNQLASLVLPDRAQKPPDRQSWQRHFLTVEQRATVRAFVETRAARERAGRASRGVNAQRLDNFMLGLERAHRLHDYPDFFSAMSADKDFAAQAQIAASALAAGVSRTVNVRIGGGFDTHTDNHEQAGLFDTAFADFTALMDLLAATPSPDGGTLLDDTVVMLLSEMGRTPLLNDDDGKDHWPFTSGLIAGCGIRGAHITGATTDTLVGETVDFETGDVSASGDILNAENLIAGVLELFDIDPGNHMPGVASFRGFHA